MLTRLVLVLFWCALSVIIRLAYQSPVCSVHLKLPRPSMNAALIMNGVTRLRQRLDQCWKIFIVVRPYQLRKERSL